MNITLPKRGSDNNLYHYSVALGYPKKNLYIIGGNGSGKSRLGLFIEATLKSQGQRVLRIAAQKVLSIPNETVIRSVETIDTELQNSHNRALNFNNAGNPNHVTSITNDFTQILNKLFSLKAERDAKFIDAYRSSPGQVVPSSTPIELIETIWREIFPHRRIVFGNGKVEAEVNLDGYVYRYSANEMSDGERGALYLLSHALTASPNSVIIYDEPEGHLHKSLLNRVWNLLEQYTQDKNIVVITHDLDLVASRKNSYKLWIKEYKGNEVWDWEFIDNQDDIPENMLLELLGSRKKVLFVEGVKNGDDQKLFQEIYTDYYVVPCDSCERVIHMTKSLNSNSFWKAYKSLGVMAKGIIDRDNKTDSDAEYLKLQNVELLKVAELENLLCLPDVLRIVAQNQGIYNFEELKFRIIENLQNFLKNHLMYEAYNDLKLELAEKLKVLNKNNVTEFVKKYDSDFKTFDPKIRLQELRLHYSNILASSDLELILKSFGNKGIISQISLSIGVSNYKELIIRLISSDSWVRNQLIEALRMNLPVI